MTQDDFGIAAMMSEMRQIMREQGSPIVAIALSYVAFGVATDLLVPTAAGLLNGILALFVGFETIARALGVPSESSRRYGSYLGVCILSGLGILVGLVLLVLPGLFLAARWSIAPAFVVSEADNASDAMSKSWDLTRPVAWHLVVAILILWVPVVASFALAGYTSVRAGLDLDSFVPTAIMNLLSAFASFGGWILAAAAFRLLRGREGYENVFA